MSTTAELAEYERREADAVDARLRAEVRAREEGAERLAADVRAHADRKGVDEAAERRAQAAAEAAPAAERKRVEDANQQHQAEINRAACWALMDHAGCGIDTAEAVIAAIIRKQIPHVTIDY